MKAPHLTDMQLNIDKGKRGYEMMFMGLDGMVIPLYPKWLYKEGEEPLLVKDKKEEQEAVSRGFDFFSAGALANRYLINWFWDLEDMSAKQLSIFAKEELGVDLPEEAGQEKLFTSVIELTRYAPQNHGRMILMAHSMEMNYTETLAEIKRVMDSPSEDMEYTSFEVML